MEPHQKLILDITCTVGIPDPHTNCITFSSRCPSTSGMRRKFGEPSIRLHTTLSGFWLASELRLTLGGTSSGGC